MFKKLLSFLLAAVMLFTVAQTSAAAYAEEAKKSDVTPIVVVPGIGSSALYSYPNTVHQGSPITIDDTLFNAVSDTHITGDLLRIMAGAKVEPKTFINKLSAVTRSLRSLNCDENGNSVGNIGIDCYWTDSLANHLDYLDSRSTAEPAVCKIICDNIGAENVWLFNYDFRMDVVEDADQLAEFISDVKIQSGHDKVTLVSASLGTSVVSAYIDRYKSRNDIKRTVFLDGAFQGTSVGKLFKKELIIDEDEINNYIDLLAACYVADTIDFGSIQKVFSMFDGTVSNLVEFLNELSSEENIDALYTEVVLPLLGNIPSLWECIPYDDFDEALEIMLELGAVKVGSGLFEKITRYHDIQGRLEENLKSLQEKGVEIAIVCGYELPQMPFTSLAGNQSDMLIDTCYASFGATTADAGEKVENATSPDGCIDASTCKFENNTWFIKGVQHMEFVYGTNVNEFVGYLATTGDALNVKSVAEATEYTQYMGINSDYVMSSITE